MCVCVCDASSRWKARFYGRAFVSFSFQSFTCASFSYSCSLTRTRTSYHPTMHYWIWRSIVLAKCLLVLFSFSFFIFLVSLFCMVFCTTSLILTWKSSSLVYLFFLSVLDSLFSWKVFLWDSKTLGCVLYLQFNRQLIVLYCIVLYCVAFCIRYFLLLCTCMHPSIFHFTFACTCILMYWIQIWLNSAFILPPSFLLSLLPNTYYHYSCSCLLFCFVCGYSTLEILVKF